MMQQIVATMVFSGAAAASGAVIFQSVAPQWRRIVRLASGQQEIAFAPLAQLAETERRIAVRRWAADSRPRSPWTQSAAA